MKLIDEMLNSDLAAIKWSHLVTPGHRWSLSHLVTWAGRPGMKRPRAVGICKRGSDGGNNGKGPPYMTSTLEGVFQKADKRNEVVA